jgi:hypothetical protein
MSKPYQGHKSYNAWSVNLHLFNEQALYLRMREIVRSSRTLDRAAERLADELAGQSTAEGVKITKHTIRLALQHWDK